MKIATYETALSDHQWHLLRRFLPAAKKRGRPRTALREVLNGILYLSDRQRAQPHDGGQGPASPLHARGHQPSDEALLFRHGPNTALHHPRDPLRRRHAIISRNPRGRRGGSNRSAIWIAALLQHRWEHSTPE